MKKICWTASINRLHSFHQQTVQFPAIDHPVSVSRPSSFRQQTVLFPSRERPVSVNNPSSFRHQTVQFPSIDHPVSAKSSPVSFNRTSSFLQNTVQFLSIDKSHLQTAECRKYLNKRGFHDSGKIEFPGIILKKTLVSRNGRNYIFQFTNMRNPGFQDQAKMAFSFLRMKNMS